MERSDYELRRLSPEKEIAHGRDKRMHRGVGQSGNMREAPKLAGLEYCRGKVRFTT
jgi:hypothetical protein